MKPRMIILFGLTMFLALASACKPESGSNLKQQTITTPTFPIATATYANVAPTTIITSITNTLPLCQFSPIVSASPVPPLSINDYIVSPLAVILTSTNEVDVYSWLPDNERLLIERWNPVKKKATLDTLHVATGVIKTYAERTYIGGKQPIWLPDLRALAYIDYEYPKKPNTPAGAQLWISRGNPRQIQRLAEGVAISAQTVDHSGHLAFFSRANQNNSNLVALSIKAVDAKTASIQDLPLPATLDAEPALTASSSTEAKVPFSFIPRPTTAQTALFYRNGPSLLLDFNSNQVCQIDPKSYVTEANWSPDGRFLAMRTQRMPLEVIAPDTLIILDTYTNEIFEIDGSSGLNGML